MTRTTLGEFEQQVMLAILRLQGESYSVPIVLELEERTGREVAQAAVFIALQRMENKGFMTSRLDDEAVQKTGRVRRYFKPTEAGLERLRRARRAAVRLWDGLEGLLDET